MLPGAVAQPRRAPRLVERYPSLHVAAERPRDDVDVLGEALGGVAHAPTALVLERLGQVPVVEGERRLDAPGAKPVDQPVVEVEPALVGRTLARGLYPGPGDREPVRGDAKLAEQVEVLLHPVVVVAGDVAGVAVPHGAGLTAEGVPYRGPPAVLGGRPFDLVGSGGRSPEEAWWEEANRALAVRA